MVYYPQESLYKPYKYHGYTVRGTPNCPLIEGPKLRTNMLCCACWFMLIRQQKLLLLWLQLEDQEIFRFPWWNAERFR